MIPTHECTAQEYLTQGVELTTIPQMRILSRSIDYGCSSLRWVLLGATDLAAAYARTSATLAKLAFLDLDEAL